MSETMGSTSEAAKDSGTSPRNSPSCLTVLVAPSTDRPESSIDPMILAISSITSFEINK